MIAILLAALLNGGTGALACLAVTESQARAPVPPLSSAIKAHMTFLADDMLEGRGTGTRGHEIAARYVAAQFEAIGLETRLQPVPMRRAELIANESRIELIRDDGTRKILTAGRDAIMAGDFRGTADVEAPLVFAGFGVTAPEHQYDDYAKIDARGKIVAVTGGAPKDFNAEERAHYSSAKGENAAAHGAIGIVRLWTAEDETSGTWDATVRSYSSIGSFAWLEGDAPHPFLPQLRGTAWIGPLQMALPPRIHIVNKSKTADLQSPNVIGVLRGSDPVLRDEYVVISAHLDHLGIGAPINGDAIYNGAVDNASGVATLIELARKFAAAPPRRSLLFIAVTGEEPGLIGSDFFAQHPTVSRDAIVADINIDGASMWDYDALFARGADHSTLKANVEASGETIVADPFPDQAGFVRSDQYSFVRIGVPSIILGAKRSGDARTQALDWVKNRYHQPSDDMSQPLDFIAAARFTDDLFKIAQSIAQQDQRPKWNKGDFFGERFGTAATKGD